MRTVEDAIWFALVIMLFCCLPLLSVSFDEEEAETAAIAASRYS